jgi:hypothetical protein
MSKKVPLRCGSSLDASQKNKRDLLDAAVAKWLLYQYQLGPEPLTKTAKPCVAKPKAKS